MADSFIFVAESLTSFQQAFTQTLNEQVAGDVNIAH